MAAMDARPPEFGSFPNNGARRDPIRSKIDALLDDVTVPTTVINAGSTLRSSTSNTVVADARSGSALFVARENGAPAEFVAPPTPAVESASPPSSSTPPPPFADPAPLPEINAGAISIKGRTDGVAIEIGKGNWADLLANLAERLAQASDFFRGGKVALDIGARPLLENELAQVRETLEHVGLKLGAVRTKSERTFQAALNLGLATKLDPPDPAEAAEAQPAGSNREGERYFVYRGNLRSGQVLQKREHILVIGDVNPGAEVISAGDIFVWGRLRGIVHAGADGDTRSVIVAFELDPVQLQVAGVAAVAPEEPTGLAARLLKKRTTVKRPELAYLNNQQVLIEPWDESKPGGLAAFRR